MKRHRRVGLVAAAILLVAMSVLFPLHVVIEPQPVGQPVYRVSIGNTALAHDADSTCDGVDDHVEIQALVDLLPAAVGGRIEIEAGYYSWGIGETVTRNISNVTILGVGGLVSIDGDDTTPLFEAGGDGWTFENIVTDAGGIDTGATSGYLFRNVLIDTTFYAFVTDNIDIEDHNARHESGGDDAIKLDDLATPDDNSDLDSTTGYHGLLPKLAGNASVFLSGNGTWLAPAGAGEGDMLKSTYDTDEDDLIDTAAGGTEWDSSAATGVAYITTGTWSTRPTGIADTNIVIVSGSVASTEHCRFTADGIEGLSSAELLAALSGKAGASFDWNGQDLTNVGDVAGAVMESDYNATTFLYATLDDTPEPKTPAEVLAILSGEAGASFDWNGQDLTNVGDVDGRDVSADGTKLDGIEAGADVTDAANVAAAGAVMESDYDAQTILHATLDDTPVALTVNEQEVVGRLTGGDIAGVDIGITDDDIVQIDSASVADDDYAKFTAAGLEGRDYDEVRTDLSVPDTTTATVTLYVDGALGDDGNSGTSGSPKETIQGALDALPTVIAHDAIIKVRGQQSYAESNQALDFSRFSTLTAIGLRAINSNDEYFYDTGKAESGTSTTLTDTDKSWSTDQFNSGYIWIYEGTGAGQVRTISDTTSTVITVSSSWSTNPDNTSYYTIGGGASLTGTGTNHIVTTGKQVNITGFRFTGATGFCVELRSYSTSYITYCYFDSAVDGIKPVYYSRGYISGCYFDCSSEGIRNDYGSLVTLVQGTFKDCDYGLWARYMAFAELSGTTGSKCFMEGGSKGIYITHGSGVAGANQCVFSVGDPPSTPIEADANSWYT